MPGLREVNVAKSSQEYWVSITKAQGVETRSPVKGQGVFLPFLPCLQGTRCYAWGYILKEWTEEQLVLQQLHERMLVTFVR